MENPERDQTITLALAGNPNSGKTTIFNALTGANQHVGNYPGVTVERKTGKALFRDFSISVLDLPGIYSLTAYSPDEKVSRNVLLLERPQVVVDVVDAGNLERNLYLAAQLIEMKLPLVLAFNMMDEAEKRGIRIETAALAELLGVPIVPTVGAREQGIEQLLATAMEVAQSGRRPAMEVRFGPEVDRAVAEIQAALDQVKLAEGLPPRWVATKLLEGDLEVREWVRAAGGEPALRKTAEMKDRLKSRLGDDPESLLADARYGWIHGAVSETVHQEEKSRRAWSERVDTVLAHRVLGFPIFLLIMWLTFEVTFKLGQPLGLLLQYGVNFGAAHADALLPPGLIRSLIVEGVIAGVGGVIVFLPNILLLFMMVALMEDSGYMARAAFLVDRVMHLVGLHGKSFIPLFLGFGCNVPAIMGARVLENERDRRVTIMITPFISCSARLPVYVLLAGTFFGPSTAGYVIFSLYLLGILVAMTMAKLLRTFVVAGPPVPFVMELPPYRRPTLRGVVWHMWERAFMYVKKAGTIILAMSVIVWFFSHFPETKQFSPEVKSEIEKVGPEKMWPAELKVKISRERLAQSYAGRIGSLMSPGLAPAGLDDWRVGISLLTGFVAKEVVVSTMGTLYSVAAAGPQSANLQAALKADNFFTPLRAYAFMVFVLLYVPCLATIAVAYRELGSLKWVALMVAINLSVAYLMAAAVWWAGKLLGLG